MKRWIMSAGLVVLFGTACPAVWATTYYLADCRPGAAAGCAPGNAGNDGTSAARPKQTPGQLPQLRGGDKVLFAKGGAWTDAAMRIYVPTATASHPVVWDSYVAAWGGSAKPILTEAREGRRLFGFDDGGVKAADGGYVVRNLDLRGGGTMGGAAGSAAGVFMYWSVNDLVLENLDISGFKVGVQAEHNPKAANGWENHRVALRGSRIQGNLMHGFLGGAANLVIENNSFDRNGTQAVYDHSIYIASAADAVIRNNTLTRNVLDRAGKCTASVIVVHGGVDGLIVEGNRITQPPGSAPTCYGIEVSAGYGDNSPGEYFHDVAIRANLVVDVGYVGVGVRGCTGCTVENNAIVWTTGPAGSQGISMGMNNPSAGDERGGALTVRNNSVYMHAPAGTATGVRLINEGTRHSVTGNMLVFGPGGGAARCFDAAGYRIGEFSAFNHNLCFRRSGSLVYSPAFGTLEAARAAGFDTQGVAADPMLLALPSAANGYSLAVSTQSPAVRAGSQALSATKDIAGRLRSAPPDIGAFQVSIAPASRPPPLAPTSVVAN